MKPTVKANNTKQPATVKPNNSKVASVAANKPVVSSLPKGVTEKDLQAIVSMHYDYLKAQLVNAIEIGDKLIPIKAKVGHGKWLDWIKAYLPQISPRSISLYVRLSEYRLFLEREFKFNLTKPLTLKNVPTIDDADKAIRMKEGNKAGGKKKVASKKVEGKLEEIQPTEKVGTRKGTASQSKPDIIQFTKYTYDDYKREVMEVWEKMTMEYHVQGKKEFTLLEAWSRGYIEKWYKTYGNAIKKA